MSTGANTGANLQVVETGNSKRFVVIKGKASFPRARKEAIRLIELPGSKDKSKEVLASAGSIYFGYIEKDQVVKLKH